MKQTIIFTTLPAGRLNEGGNSFLRLSLHCSMRLSHTSATTMAAFPEIIQWAQKIKNVQGFKVQWNKTLLSDAVADTQVIQPQLWETLIHQGIKVSNFIVEDNTKAKIHAYPVKELNDTILKVYREFGIKTPVNLVKPHVMLQNQNLLKAGRFQVDPQILNTYSLAVEKKAPKADIRTGIKRLKPDQLNVIRKNVQSPVIKDYQRILASGNYQELRTRNIEPEFQFTRFRDFHRLDRELKKIVPEEVTVPEFEFHDIIAQMGDHPQMQRKLGLVINLRVPVPDGIPAEGTVSAFPYGLEFEGDSEITVTATAYRLSAGGFFARERPGIDTDFYNGFVKLNTGEFTVSQIDTDGAAMQAINQADTNVVHVSEKTAMLRSSIMQMTPDDEKVDDTDDEKTTEDDQAEGLPALRSAGIAIVKNNIDEYLNRKFVKSLDLNLKLAVPGRITEQVITANRTLLGIRLQAKSLNINLPDTEVLYAGDLITGYRMDVAYADEPEKWYSLHYKQDEITCFDKDMKPLSVEGILPDEGFCQIAVTGDKKSGEDLFVSGVIARWTGWSLAVERPGYPIDEAESEDGKDHINRRSAVEEKEYWSKPDTNVRMNVRTTPVPGTLPRLRFGRSYNLRMRYVDIAGNSVPPEAQPEKPDESIVRNFTYHRYEPLGTPVVLQGNRMKVGEDIERMVIKSNYDVPAEKYAGADVTNENRNSIRIMVPPQASQQMAELHGKFDQAFSGDAEAARRIYEIICSREVPPGAGEPQDKIYSADSFTVKYLPDPAAAGIAFFLADGYENTHTQSFKPQHVRYIPSGKGASADAWLDPFPITIRLLEGEAASQWDGKSTLTFYLPKGHRAKIRYSSIWEADNLQKLSGIRHHLSLEKDFMTAREHLEAGRHWMVSPSREIELVHAVQQPLTEPELQDTAADRGYNDTPAWIKMKIKVHGQSTGKVDIEAKWEDWDDNPLKPLPEKVTSGEMLDPVQIGYKDQIKYVGYTPPKSTDFTVINVNPPAIQATQVMTRSGAGGKMPVMERKETAATNAKTVSLIGRFSPAFVIKAWGLMHSFSDTRHRFVDYKPLASSRYGEYFRKRDANGNLQPTEGIDITRTGKSARVNILSSARPLPPEVEYIIPTFNWQKSGEKDRQTHIRMGGGLRVYLRRPWFSSGEGELLAAVLNPGGMIPASAGSDRVLYSQWGTDPVYPLPGDTDPWLELSDFRWQTGQEKGLVYPGVQNLRADIAAFPARFDAERKLWYADMMINPGNKYFPFVKLMLSRYQEHSLRINKSDVCLSPVVETDFIQLLPERKVQINVERRNGRAMRLMVQISGFRYQDFSNTFEIHVMSEDIPQPFSASISRAIAQADTKARQSGIRDIQFPNDRSFVATGYFDITSDLRDLPFSVVVLEYEKADVLGSKRLVFSDEFKCGK